MLGTSCADSPFVSDPVEVLQERVPAGPQGWPACRCSIQGRHPAYALQVLEALLCAAAHTAGHAVAADTPAPRRGACSHSTWESHKQRCGTAGTCSTKQDHFKSLDATDEVSVQLMQARKRL